MRPFVLNYALREVVSQGTARSAKPHFATNMRLAGKTGTTDGLRDSWFAGYSQNVLSVVWLGHDSNEPTGLTGASGALRVWSSLMKQLPLNSLPDAAPKGVTWRWVDLNQGVVKESHCDGGCPDPIFGSSIATRINMRWLSARADYRWS